MQTEGICKWLAYLSTTCVSIRSLSPLPCLQTCSVVYFSSHFQEKAHETCYVQREVGDGVESNYIKRLAQNAKVYSGNLREKKN